MTGFILTLEWFVVTKGYKYLITDSAFSFRFAQVFMSSCYHYTLKGERVTTNLL